MCPTCTTSTTPTSTSSRAAATGTPSPPGSSTKQDRLTALTLDYSEYVKDGESECRAKVERAIEGKVGRGNEFLYDWDEEGNHLAVRILPPLPGGLAAQPWPVAEIEYVLGITDPDSAGRLVPVLLPEEPDTEAEPLPPNVASRAAPAPEGWRTAAVAPVVWRVGSPCPHPHLLVTGAAGSGKTTVLRSLLGQALGRGQQVAVIDVEQSEAYDDLADRPGVRGVVDDAERALQLLDWVGLECERRAERRRAAAEALAAGDTSSIPTVQVRGDGGGVAAEMPARDEVPPCTDPLLWLCVDGLPELLEAAARSGRPDLGDTIAVLARKARYANVLLLITAGEDQVLTLRPALRAQLTVRVAMGSVDAGRVHRAVRRHARARRLAPAAAGQGLRPDRQRPRRAAPDALRAPRGTSPRSGRWARPPSPPTRPLWPPRAEPGRRRRPRAVAAPGAGRRRRRRKRRKGPTGWARPAR